VLMLAGFNNTAFFVGSFCNCIYLVCLEIN
jgi:hypothetical protein